MSSCSGCKSSCSTAKGTLRLARKIKRLEPSNLDQCLKCECNECTCECKLTITATETTVENDITVEGTIYGNLHGTVVGDLCAGRVKGTVQIVSNPATSDDITITSTDLITQLRIGSAGTYSNANLNPGSEGQLKIIHLVADADATVVEIGLIGTTGTVETLVLTSNVAGGEPSSAQLYYIGGTWYAYQTQNGIIT